MRRLLDLYCLLLLASLLSCTREPEPINYGHDACAYCRMMIVEDLYGAALLTDKGRTYKYDSVECLAAAYIDLGNEKRAAASLYVIDFENAGDLMPLDSAIFVQAKRLPSPMGLNLSAHSKADVADHVAEMYFGERLDWGALVLLVKQEWKK